MTRKQKIISLISIASLSGFLLWPNEQLIFGATTDTFTSTGTWEAPAGVTEVTVECWGGGGAGSQGQTSNGKAGGGGGAYAKTDSISVTPSSEYDVIIGPGGQTNSAAGGDSYFDDGSEILAKEGLGGNGFTAGVGGQADSSVGDTTYSGGTGGGNGGTGGGSGGGGGAGTTEAGSNGVDGDIGNPGDGGAGGADDGGAGGEGGTGIGQDGNTLGGGGGGGASFNANGGKGARGECRITYESLTNFVYVSADTNASPGTVPEDDDVNFTIYYATSSASTFGGIKGKVCKTDSLTNQNCDGGYYASSTAFGLPSPLSAISYTTTNSDIGSNTGYAYACGDDGTCSATSTSVSFTVLPERDLFIKSKSIKIKSGILKINK